MHYCKMVKVRAGSGCIGGKQDSELEVEEKFSQRRSDLGRRCMTDGWPGRRCRGNGGVDLAALSVNDKNQKVQGIEKSK